MAKTFATYIPDLALPDLPDPLPNSRDRIYATNDQQQTAQLNITSNRNVSNDIQNITINPESIPSVAEVLRSLTQTCPTWAQILSVSMLTTLIIGGSVFIDVYIGMKAETSTTLTTTTTITSTSTTTTTTTTMTTTSTTSTSTTSTTSTSTSTTTTTTSTTTTVPPSTSCATATVNSIIYNNQFIYSPAQYLYAAGMLNNRFGVYRSYGYANVTSTALWTCPQSGVVANSIFAAQQDGNLVVYAANGTVLWASHTASSPFASYCLQMLNSGNLIWTNAAGTII